MVNFVVDDAISCRAVQTVREIDRVGDGLGLRVHFIRKASDDVKKSGSKLFRKFGKYCRSTGSTYALAGT